jgi:hypothetical protein
MENLIQAGEFYYHPLTRVPPKPHRMTMNAEGELIEEPDPAPKLAFRASLSPDDIVSYYYRSTGTCSTAYLRRDCGSVKYLVKTFGLDKTLFAIDAMIADYMEGDDREAHVPDLIGASNYVAYAEDRMGEVALINRQYGISCGA